MRSSQLIALTLAVAGAPVSAFWRMECRGVSGRARLDPLVDFNEAPGAHAHEIFGSGGFSSTADYESLIASDCTSCAVTADKSAYWTPYPLFKDSATGEYEAVKNVGGMLAYYFLNSAPSGDKSIVAFPQGFRMIAGDTNRRNYTVGDSSYEDPDPAKSLWASLGQTSQTDLAQRAVGFNCLDYSKTAEGSLYRHFLPSKDYIDAYCPDGIRFELMFPTCWDGVNLDSDDHKSHVAYPDLVIDGNCPDDFPVRLPGLFYETIYDMGAYTDRDGIFVMSNGDPLGFGYHGDFIMGWDETEFTLQDAVDTCTNLDGEIESCPLFTILSESEQQECSFDMPSALDDDDCDGPMTGLPGNVKLSWGPGPANGDETVSSGDGSSSIVTLSTLSYSAGVSASGNGVFEPGNIFKVTPTTTTPTTTTPPTAATVTIPPTTAPTAPNDNADNPDVTYFTYTGANGDVIINAVVYEQAIAWVTDYTTATVYVDPTNAPAPTNTPLARRDHVHAHAHKHAHKHRRGRKY